MLRRIANHFFWMARYLERAQWRARLVDVNYHLLVETPPGPQEGWEPLLLISGDREVFQTRFQRIEEQQVLEFFIFDEQTSSSIRSCIALARENCRSSRNLISWELWLEINTLYLDSRLWTADALQELGVYAFFAYLRERFYRIAGAMQNTMSRGLSYDFLTVGQMLEAAENVSRLLDVKYHFLLPRVEDVGSPMDLRQWEAVLRSASALEAYRLTYGNAVTVERVVEFLLFDPNFPRAARFSIQRLTDALSRITAGGEQTEEMVPAASELAARLGGQSAATVISQGLHDYLLDMQRDCARIGDEVSATYLNFD